MLNFGKAPFYLEYFPQVFPVCLALVLLVLRE